VIEPSISTEGMIVAEVLMSSSQARWIHANVCPRLLHKSRQGARFEKKVLAEFISQILIKKGQNRNKIPVCMAVAETSHEGQDSEATCLSGRDLSGHDYISVSRDGLIPISVKPANITRLNSLSLQ
jgi:hypothetical protein